MEGFCDRVLRADMVLVVVVSGLDHLALVPFVLVTPSGQSRRLGRRASCSTSLRQASFRKREPQDFCGLAFARRRYPSAPVLPGSGITSGPRDLFFRNHFSVSLPQKSSFKAKSVLRNIWRQTSTARDCTQTRTDPKRASHSE